MLRKADLGTFKAEVNRLGDDAKLRLEGGGKLTTAERSVGGRAARFFGGVTKQDKADNLQIKGQLLKALKGQYGDEIATRAFSAALGKDVKAGKDGGILVAVNNRLTARQVRAAIDNAEAMVANNRTKSSVAAFNYTPGMLPFRTLAHDAGIDPGRLSPKQQDFIRERVMSLVSQSAHTDRHPDGLVDKDEIKKIAKDVTRQVAKLSDQSIDDLRGQYKEAAKTGAGFMKAISSRSEGADAIVGRLADTVRDTGALPSADTYFGKGEGLGADDFKTAADVSLRQAARRGSPSEASTGFNAAMAPDGQGRALLFALGALGELPGIGHDGYSVGALTKLTDTAKQAIVNLGQEGGHRVDANDVAPVAASAEGVKWSSDGTTLTIPPDVLKRAGISDESQVHELVAQLRTEMPRMADEIRAEEQRQNDAIALQLAQEKQQVTT